MHKRSLGIRTLGIRTLGIRTLGIAAAGALALFALPPAGNAAPLSSAAGELKGAGNPVEKAAYRHCWWRNGERFCRWVGYRHYDDYDDYGYGPSYGYGFGPFIGFGFGGGGGRFHGGHHHR